MRHLTLTSKSLPVKAQDKLMMGSKMGGWGNPWNSSMIDKMLQKLGQADGTYNND